MFEPFMKLRESSKDKNEGMQKILRFSRSKFF